MYHLRWIEDAIFSESMATTKDDENDDDHEEHK